MTNDYRLLTDEAIEAHDASLREQMKGLVAERARRRKLDMWPALTMITDHLDTLADGSLQTLVVAWSTHGGLIEAELARRSEVRKGSSACSSSRVDGRQAFADMLKEHNPGHDDVDWAHQAAELLKRHDLDDPAASRLLKDIAEQPELGNEAADYCGLRLFTDGELQTASCALLARYKRHVDEGNLAEANYARDDGLAIQAELKRRQPKGCM